MQATPNGKTQQHVLVVGAGIIGGMIAVSLQDLGHQVTLLDAGFVGQATRASGGMLAASSEALSLPPAWRERAQQSLHLWQMWLDRFQRLGTDVGYVAGLGHAASTSKEAIHLQTTGHWQSHLPEHPLGMAYFPEEGSLDPVKVLEVLHRQCPVTTGELLDLQENAKGVLAFTSIGDQQVDRVVLACGAWTSRFGIDVRPRQGQALVVQGQHVKHALYKGKGYLVPRGKHTYVGATEMETWDVQATRGAMTTLLGYFRQQTSNLDACVLEHRVGLRPYREEPLVGPHPGLKNVLVATGHHRNGILLAPVTAQVVTELFMQGSRASYGPPVH